jgi:hypothetical protein
VDKYPNDFATGILELVAMLIELDTNYVVPLLKPGQIDRYQKWRDSFGEIPPEDIAKDEGNDPFINFCKERVALDAFERPTSLRHQLESIFNVERRNCDLKENPVRVTEENKTGSLCRIFQTT